jgi:hypothetical protein
MDSIKEEYDVLIKKHKLPKFEVLDEEFEIRALEENRSGRPVKAIIRVVASRLRSFLEILDPVVSPNPSSIHSMMAANNLSEAVKKDMYESYKKIGALYHECLYEELETDESAAKFIKRFMKDWPKLKEKQKKFMKLIISTWSKEIPKQKAGYYS